MSGIRSRSQAGHQRRVLQAAHPVVDPLRAEDVQRLRHVGGRTLLTGVGDHAQPQRPAAGEHPGELLRRVAALAGVEPHAEDPVAVRQRLLQGREGVGLRQVAEEAEDQGGAHAQPARLPAGSRQAAIPRATVADAPGGVGLGIEEISARTTPLRGRALRGTPRRDRGSPARCEAPRRGVVEVEERLEAAVGVVAAQVVGVAVGQAIRLRSARARTSSGSRVPSMCRWSSANGSIDPGLPLLSGRDASRGATVRCPVAPRPAGRGLCRACRTGRCRGRGWR